MVEISGNFFGGLESSVIGREAESLDRDVSSALREQQFNLIDLVDLSDAVVESLAAADQILASLEIYREVFDGFLNDRFVAFEPFGTQAIRIFESREGDVAAVIERLEERHSEIQEFFTARRQEEEFEDISVEISQANTQGELSFLRAKVNELRAGSVNNPKAQAAAARLLRVIDLREQGEEDAIVDVFATFIDGVQGSDGAAGSGFSGGRGETP